jgi:hypothetical protein
MAEFETYHRQKVEDFERLATEHLDGEIEFYEQVRSPFNDNISLIAHASIAGLGAAAHGSRNFYGATI